MQCLQSMLFDFSGDPVLHWSGFDDVAAVMCAAGDAMQMVKLIITGACLDVSLHSSRAAAATPTEAASAMCNAVQDYGSDQDDEDPAAAPAGSFGALQTSAAVIQQSVANAVPAFGHQETGRCHRHSCMTMIMLVTLQHTSCNSTHKGTNSASFRQGCLHYNFRQLSDPDHLPHRSRRWQE